MSVQFRARQGGNKKEKDDDYMEVTFFNGECHRCGKKGHKKKDCPDAKKKNGDKTNNNQPKKKFPGTCNRCGKYGHKESDCWEKEKNTNQRPKNWKS